MRKPSVLVNFLILFAMLGVATANLYGQAATASATLQGTVTDASGAVVPNAELKITAKETGATRTTTSGAEGQYRFDLLAPGIYEVRCTMRGFAVAVYQNVGLAVGRTATINVNLEPSTQQVTVTVEASGAALIDLQRTDVSRPITPERAGLRKPRGARSGRACCELLRSDQEPHRRVRHQRLEWPQCQHHGERHRQQGQHGGRPGDAVAPGSHPGVQHQHPALLGG
jgi:archaellum component FlaF (FlaF/FlaG flagellin family)